MAPMPIRAKSRRSSTRRTTAVAARPSVRTKQSPTTDRWDDVRKSLPDQPVHVPGSNGFAKALRYLATLNDFERLCIVRYNDQNFNLDRMRLLFKRLGNPQDAFRSVHIAGTKGKGSTCAMTASMLQTAGYKVGLYTSP